MPVSVSDQATDEARSLDMGSDTSLEAAVFVALVGGLEALCFPAPDVVETRARLGVLASTDRDAGLRSARSASGGRDWQAFVRLAMPAQLDKAAILAAHRMLLPGHPWAGRLRPPGRCVVRCPSTGLVIHTPPPAAQVPAGLARWLAGAHPDDGNPFWPLDALLDLLILHPLADGNGRVARLCTAALCWRNGLRDPQWLHAVGGLYRHQGQAIRAGSMEVAAGRGRQPWHTACRQAMDQAQAWWSGQRLQWSLWWLQAGRERPPPVLPIGSLPSWAV
ncbi:MAG: Fic family protein [Xanthomonadales bacterium]|nr:Fic family protein [Xanthomonadales bacterium]